MAIMTTATLNTFYCTFCDAVAHYFDKTIQFCESAGTARAASQLAAMGHYDAARQLMLSLKDTK